MEAVHDLSRCPECGASNLIRDYENGELVCEQCGYVVSSNLLDQGPEWRAFDREQSEKRERVGAPMTWALYDKGLSTSIDWRGRSVNGRPLKPEERIHSFRLQKWHKRTKMSSSNQRNLSYALSEMSTIASRLSLPDSVLETASIMYRGALKAKIVRGRSILTLVAASLYMACRRCNVVRKIDEIARAAHVSRKDCGRTYRVLFRTLGEEVPRFDPVNYLSKFVSVLNISGKTELVAKGILDKIAEAGMKDGRGSSGIAAAALYTACKITGEIHTQSEIARVAEITEVTIRNRYKEMTRKLLVHVRL